LRQEPISLATIYEVALVLIIPIIKQSTRA